MVFAGVIFFPKCRGFIVETGIGGKLNNHNNLIVIGLVFLTFGVFVSSNGINNQNLDQWRSNKQEIIKKLESSIESNNLNEAKNTIDKFKVVVKNDAQFDALVAKYTEVIDKAAAEKLAEKAAYRAKIEKENEEKAAAERAKAALELKQQARNPSNSTAINGPSQVVSIIGTQIHLANGKWFSINKSTLLHIDGQIYPKSSIDYIQVGYRCRGSGGIEVEPAEIFCEK